MQQDLFGEPRRDPQRSQWFTPMWIARRMARAVPRHARVLEPSCGGGNLIAALLENGHPRDLIVACEIDQEWAQYTRNRCGVRVVCGDFLATDREAFGHVDYVVGNFPFEQNRHLHFTVHSLRLAPVVLGVFPAAFEFSGERDRDLWSTRARVTHRARLPERVDYGGDQSPSFDSVVLRIIRRMHPRPVGEQLPVYEEVWLPGEVR